MPQDVAKSWLLDLGGQLGVTVAMTTGCQAARFDRLQDRFVRCGQVCEVGQHLCVQACPDPDDMAVA